MKYQIVLLYQEDKKSEQIIKGIGDIENEDELGDIITFLAQAWVSDSKSIEIRYV